MRDTSARPEKLSWFVGCAGALLLCAGVFLARAGNVHAATPACAGAATVILLALAAAGRTRLTRKHAQEELAFEDFRRQHGRSELFDDADEAVRMAARTSEHYAKYFVPFFTIVLGLAIVITGFCPEIFVSASTASSRCFFSPMALPTPMLMEIFSSLGSESRFLRPKSSLSLVWISSLYRWYSRGIILICRYFGAFRALGGEICPIPALHFLQ